MTDPDTGPTTGRAPTLLVRRGLHEPVCEALGRTATVSGSDRALVRVAWSDHGLGAQDALATAQKTLGARYDDVSRLVVPNPVLSRDADPVTGQPKTFGGGRGAPTAAAALPDRAGAATGSADGPGDGAGVTVGVVDTRLVPHDWLVGSYLAAPQEIEREAQHLAKAGRRGSDVGHATFIAGLVLQQAPAATLRALHVLEPDGSCELFDLVQAVRRVARTGVDVLNLSLGCYTDGDELPWPLLDALEELPQGSVVVAAAGNHDPEEPAEVQQAQRPFWPAALPHVLAVGALDRADRAAAPFSNDGSWVDLWASGDELVSTFVRGPAYPTGWASWGGTSFASAVVAGVIATRTSHAGRVSARQAAYELLAELSGGELHGASQGGRPVVLRRTAERYVAP